MSPDRSWDMKEPTHLYRLYDIDRRLLYVGITVDLERRMAKHAMDKSWWRDVETGDLALYPTRYDAKDAEHAAIVVQRPRYNMAGGYAGETSGADAYRAEMETFHFAPTEPFDPRPMGGIWSTRPKPGFENNAPDADCMAARSELARAIMSDSRLVALYAPHAPDGTATAAPSSTAAHTERPSDMSDTPTLCRSCGQKGPLDILGYCPDCGDIAPPHTISRSTAVPSATGGNEATPMAGVASSTQHLTNEGRQGLNHPGGPTTRGGTPRAVNTE